MEEMIMSRWRTVSRRGAVLALIAAICLPGCLGLPPRREVIAQAGESPDPATTPAERPGGLIGSMLRLVASLVPRVYVSVPILEREDPR
jgi:hypothetical protein